MSAKTLLWIQAYSLFLAFWTFLVVCNAITRDWIGFGVSLFYLCVLTLVGGIMLGQRDVD